MNCDHQLVEMARYDDVKGCPDSRGECVKLVCAYCGHVRLVYEDGTIELIKEHGTIKKSSKQQPPA